MTDPKTRIRTDSTWLMRNGSRSLGSLLLGWAAMSAAPSHASMPPLSNALLPVCIPEAGYYHFQHIDVPVQNVKDSGDYNGLAFLPPETPKLVHRCKIGSVDIELWGYRRPRPPGRKNEQVCYSEKRDWIKVVVNGKPLVFKNMMGEAPPYETVERKSSDGWYRISGCPRVSLKFAYTVSGWGHEATMSCVSAKETSHKERCHINPLEARK